jgi:hypothetical protein
MSFSREIIILQLNGHLIVSFLKEKFFKSSIFLILYFYRMFFFSHSSIISCFNIYFLNLN